MKLESPAATFLLLNKLPPPASADQCSVSLSEDDAISVLTHSAAARGGGLRTVGRCRRRRRRGTFRRKLANGTNLGHSARSPALPKAGCSRHTSHESHPILPAAGSSSLGELNIWMKCHASPTAIQYKERFIFRENFGVNPSRRTNTEDIRYVVATLRYTSSTETARLRQEVS